MPRTITQAVSLPARPEGLWAMYVSGDEHAACTGFPVTIAPRAGAEFRAFDGAIWGSILDVVPNRLVAQRCEGWAKFYWNPWRAHLERVG